MKFDLSVKAENNKAFTYLTELSGNEALVEIIKVSPARTLHQNRYLHLIIGFFGVHFGYTLDEAKQIYKELNSGIYKYQKKGRVFWRSSADLTKEDMSRSIEIFRLKSSQAGCPLPLATDQGWLREVENEIERMRYYL